MVSITEQLWIGKQFHRFVCVLQQVHLLERLACLNNSSETKLVSLVKGQLTRVSSGVTHYQVVPFHKELLITALLTA